MLVVIVAISIIVFPKTPQTEAKRKRGYSYNPCDKITVASQGKFPLCWMFSVVNLLRNISWVHGVEFHPDVETFIADWADVDSDGAFRVDRIDIDEHACPIVRPASLRKEIKSVMGGFYQPTLTIYPKGIRLSDDSDSEGSRIEETGQGSSLTVESNFKELISRMSKVSKEDDFFDYALGGLFFRFTSDLTTSASYGNFTNMFDDDKPIRLFIDSSDPLLSEYFEHGKRFLGSHEIRIQMFSGDNPIPLLNKLLTYKNHADITHLPLCILHKHDNIKKIMSTKTEYILFSRRLILDDANKLYDFAKNSGMLNEYTDVLGGVLSGSETDPSDYHAVAFVFCGDSVRFIDSDIMWSDQWDLSISPLLRHIQSDIKAWFLLKKTPGAPK